MGAEMKAEYSENELLPLADRNSRLHTRTWSSCEPEQYIGDVYCRVTRSAFSTLSIARLKDCRYNALGCVLGCL
jgi:hypothetical protein